MCVVSVCGFVLVPALRAVGSLWGRSRTHARYCAHPGWQRRGRRCARRRRRAGRRGARLPRAGAGVPVPRHHGRRPRGDARGLSGPASSPSHVLPRVRRSPGHASAHTRNPRPCPRPRPRSRPRSRPRPRSHRHPPPHDSPSPRRTPAGRDGDHASLPAAAGGHAGAAHGRGPARHAAGACRVRARRHARACIARPDAARGRSARSVAIGADPAACEALGQLIEAIPPETYREDSEPLVGASRAALIDWAIADGRRRQASIDGSVAEQSPRAAADATLLRRAEGAGRDPQGRCHRAVDARTGARDLQGAGAIVRLAAAGGAGVQ